MGKNINIYEVEYSCSPRGVDKWEIAEEGSDYFKGGFNTVQEAISYALMDFKGQELNLNIKSLEWYHAQEEENEMEERV